MPRTAALARFAAVALLAAAPLPAATLGATSAAPTRTTSLIVYGDDACPSSSSDEIVVCAREPESERYRIPKKLRDKKRADEPEARSWTDRVAGIEEASRAQRPNSCSAVGAGGQSGCTQAMLRQWFAERQEQKAEAADIP